MIQSIRVIKILKLQKFKMKYLIQRMKVKYLILAVYLKKLIERQSRKIGK